MALKSETSRAARFHEIVELTDFIRFRHTAHQCHTGVNEFCERFSSMRPLIIGTIAATGVVAAFFATAPASSASPGDMPCTLTFTFLCNMVPALPNLDHDVDLTQDHNALNGAADIPAGSLPPPQG